jgi:uncharacterized protein YjbJ (UPF0337 family)
MKTLPWIIAGVGIGLAVYFVVNQPGPRYATGDPDVDDAANETSFWGSKQRLSGKVGGLAGKLKEGVGRATGNDQLAGEGVVDQFVGGVKDTAGQAAHAVADTVHDLNR